MTFRIDSAAITLNGWDDTLGLRRTVTFEVAYPLPADLERAVREAWEAHAVRLAQAGGGGPFIL